MDTGMSKRVANSKGRKHARSSKGRSRQRRKLRMTTAAMAWRTEQLEAQTKSSQMLREVQAAHERLERSFIGRARKTWLRLTKKR